MTLSQSRSFFCRSLCCSSPCLFLSLVPFLCTTIHWAPALGRESGKRTGRRLGATASAWSDAGRGRLGPGIRAEGPRRGCSMGKGRPDWRPRTRCAGRRRGRDRGLARRRGAAARRRARARAEEVERVPLVGRFGSSLILGVTRPAKELEHGAPRVPGQSVAERTGGDGGGVSARERGGRGGEGGARRWEGGLGRGNTAGPVYAGSIVCSCSLRAVLASAAWRNSSLHFLPAGFCPPLFSPSSKYSLYSTVPSGADRPQRLSHA
jgi:hypothetical protein